jgi:hypothetical protein
MFKFLKKNWRKNADTGEDFPKEKVVLDRALSHAF